MIEARLKATVIKK
jgi:hypothetical protein